MYSSFTLYIGTPISSTCRPSVLVSGELLCTAPTPDRFHIFRQMNTYQIPNISASDPSLRGYSRYPSQAVPKVGVRYADNPSKTMVLASARNAGGFPDVINRPRNEVLKEYRNDRAPEAMNLESKELYYQVCTAKERVHSVTNAGTTRHTLHTCREGWPESKRRSCDWCVVHA